MGFGANADSGSLEVTVTAKEETFEPVSAARSSLT